MNRNNTSETELTSSNEKYEVLKKKDGFFISWPVNEEIKELFRSTFQKQVDFIECHMKIWTKIFYTKHKRTTWNSDHSEKSTLNFLPSKLAFTIKNIDCFIEEEVNKEGKVVKNRFILHEVKTVGDKRIIYKYVIVFSKNKIKIISIHRNK